MNNPKIFGFIPARMSASRFPGKPLYPICNMPMIQHVIYRSQMFKKWDGLYLTTCDQEIQEFGESIGIPVIMTADTHTRALDRVAEAVTKCGQDIGDNDIVLNVQGDEPMTQPAMISEAVQPMLENSDILVVNLLGQICGNEELESPNCIKVVCDLQGNALYFSREPIPTRFKTNQITFGKQVCIIPFLRDFLLEYTKMSPTPLEIVESIDMLRVLEHGMKVRMIPTKYNTVAVDTEMDRQTVEKLLADDPTTSLYCDQK